MSDQKEVLPNAIEVNIHVESAAFANFGTGRKGLPRFRHDWANLLTDIAQSIYVRAKHWPDLTPMDTAILIEVNPIHVLNPDAYWEMCPRGILRAIPIKVDWEDFGEEKENVEVQK